MPTQSRRNLGFTSDDQATLNNAIRILAGSHTKARTAAARKSVLRRSVDRCRGYFESDLEGQLALLTLSIKQGYPVLDELAARRGCSNRCKGACKVSCVTYCKGTCEGGCKNGGIWF
ncbi:MAG: hypothetical protein HY655_07305 [Acidobacteria bacterium]|nr:hypothetical protein [Acidobacteriota bacterium]